MAFDRVVSDIKYPGGMNRLWDLCEVDLSGISVMDIREIAGFRRQYTSTRAGEKVVLVAPKDLEYGLSRMFQISCEEQVRIFVCRSIAEAEEWLADNMGE